MKFARYTFLVAGIYGILALVPQYFLLEQNGRDFPPAITHPEYYYGFVGVALAWQVAFLIISRNPARYRSLMLVGILEKAGFTIPVVILFAQQGVSTSIFAAGIIDLVLSVLFAVAYLKTRNV